MKNVNYQLVSIGFSLLLALVLLPGTGQAQQVLTLEDAIQLALDNNIDVKIAENNYAIAKSNNLQGTLNYLPSLSSDMDYGVRRGAFFDQNVGRVITSTTRFWNGSITANMNIFQGFFNTYNKMSLKRAAEAAKLNIEDAEQTVKVNVMTFYLQTLLNRENTRISEERIKLLEEQMERARKRAEIGVENSEAYFNFKSQLATEQLNYTNMKNLYESNKLSLLQALQVNDISQYDIAEYVPENEVLMLEAPNYEEIVNAAIEFSPGIKSAELTRLSNKSLLQRARSAYFPTISAAGRYGTSWSNNGIPSDPAGEVSGFSEQIDFNTFEYVGAFFSWNLFDRGQRENNKQVAKINMLNAELTKKQTQQTLVNTVQQAYLNLVAAQSTYRSATQSLESLEQSYAFAQKSYEAGQIDFYTYFEALNNKNRAEFELASAKYGIIFRKQILDIHMGIQ